MLFVILICSLVRPGECAVIPEYEYQTIEECQAEVQGADLVYRALHQKDYPFPHKCIPADEAPK